MVFIAEMIIRPRGMANKRKAVYNKTMDETYNLKAIILNQEPFRENDSRVAVFSLEKGKIELVARGTKKIMSKMAGHLEPISLVEIMAVRGRQFDYIGSAVGENHFINIKNDLEKLTIAGQAISIFNKLVKNGERDEKLFMVIKDYLDLLNSNELYVTRLLTLERSDGGQVSYKLLFYYFILKLLAGLGYMPELHNCLVCRKKITPQGNSFDFKKGGVICEACSSDRNNNIFNISGNCIKVMRFISEKEWSELLKLKIDDKLEKEAINIIGSFLKYHFNL